MFLLLYRNIGSSSAFIGKTALQSTVGADETVQRKFSGLEPVITFNRLLQCPVLFQPAADPAHRLLCLLQILTFGGVLSVQTVELSDLFKQFFTLLHHGGFLCNLLIKRRQFFFIHRTEIIDKRLFFCNALCPLLPVLFNGFSHPGVDGGTGDGFQQSGTFCRFSLKKGPEITLGQQHHAAELLPAQINNGTDTVAHIFYAGCHRLPGAAVPHHNSPFNLLQSSVRFIAGTFNRPGEAVLFTVIRQQIHPGGTAGLSAGKNITDISDMDRILIFPVLLISGIGFSDPVKAYRFTVDCQGHGIKNGGFSGTGIPGDGKQTAVTKQSLIKTDFKRGGD